MPEPRQGEPVDPAAFPGCWAAGEEPGPGELIDYERLNVYARLRGWESRFTHSWAGPLIVLPGQEGYEALR